MVLSLNVLHYDFIRDIATAATEIAASPKMPTPVRLSQMWILVQQLKRRFTFKFLDQSADRYLWWYRDEQVDVISGDVALHDIHILPLADFPDHIPDSKSYRSLQNLFPILRDPNQVQVDRKNSVSSVAIFGHEATIAKDR